MSVVQPEQRFGKYRILDELGRGGFATVYRAIDTTLDRTVALKILHPELMIDPILRGTLRERCAGNCAARPSSYRCNLQSRPDQGRLYRVCSSCRVARWPHASNSAANFPFVEAVRIVGEIAEALDHAHTAGFIHRDVKPTNILFNARDQAVLADFGLVKAVESSVIARSSMGNTVGTPAYIAPEIWDGKDDGPWTDVYALGCVLFEMLTGQVLFKGQHAASNDAGTLPAAPISRALAGRCAASGLKLCWNRRWQATRPNVIRAQWHSCRR